MLKAFAPLLGEFHGRGLRPDGSELICHVAGEEIIYDVCYGFRLEVYQAESTEMLVNAFIVATSDAKGNLALQFIESKEHVHGMHWLPAEHGEAATEGSRVFVFEALRSNGSLCRLVFDVISAEDFRLSYESTTSRDHHPHEMWRLSLARSHELAAHSKLRAA